MRHTHFPILDHLKYLERELVVLDDRSLLAFSACCCESQVVPLFRALGGVSPALVDPIRRSLDHVWNELEAGRIQIEYDVKWIELAQKVDTSLDSTGIVENIIGSLEHLVGVSEHNLRSRALTIAEVGLGEVEAILYDKLDLEINDESRQIICDHELFQTEISRQMTDVNYLRENSGMFGLEEFRGRCHGRDLFGGIWYS